MCLVVTWAGAQTFTLSPKTIVDFALRNNVGTQAAKYSIRSAELSKRMALAAFFPTVKMTGSVIHLDQRPMSSLGGFDMSSSLANIPPDSIRHMDQGDAEVLWLLGKMFGAMGEPVPVGNQNMTSLGLSVSQPVFAGGRLYNAYRMADQGIRAAELQDGRTAQVVRFTALQLFWGFVGAGQALRTLDDNIAWLERLSADQAALSNAGLITEDDVLRVKTQVSLLKLNRLKAGNGMRAMGENILQFCRLPLTTEIRVDSMSLADLDREVQVPDPGPMPAIDRRKDVLALQSQVHALTIARGLQRGSYLPNLFVAYSYDWKNSNLEHPEHLYGGWNIGVFLDWTIWDWARAWREAQRTETQIAQLALNVESQADAARAQIADACRRIAEAVEAEKLSLESLDNAQRAMEHADLRYREGLITSQDLLGARKDLTQAQQELIAARIGKVMAGEQYRLAVGE